MRFLLKSRSQESEWDDVGAFKTLQTEDMYRYAKHTDGNAMAIATLYEKYYTMLYGYVMRHIERRQSAEDIVQQVFLMLMEKGIELEAIENRKAYLLTLVRNEWVNYLRRENLQRQVMTETMWRNKDSTTHDQLLEREYRRILQAAIERLPVQRRKVYELSFELGMKSNAIAEELNIAKNTVRQQLRLARREVRNYVCKMVA